jgi:hypothetical protein
MSGTLMVRSRRKNNLNIDKLSENLSIKFLKKRMKKLNNELDFMSNYVFRLRIKLNNNAGDLWVGEQKREKSFGSQSIQS